MSPVIRACERQHVEYFILHTGQHYSYTMDRIFFEQLGLPEARYNLDVGSGTHGEQTGKILQGVEQVLQKEQPDIVLVEGDTNTVLAGALAATIVDAVYQNLGLANRQRGVLNDLELEPKKYSSEPGISEQAPERAA